MNHFSLLCLGDSYTVGEAVPLHKSLPYQSVLQLRKKDFLFYAPEILAKTGWTTDELDEALKGYRFLNKYDFVTLMIGVNNQYRGHDVIQYKEELEILIKKAIELAHGKKDRVIMISIPDYSTTPFASSMETGKIAKDIDVFNTVGKALSIQYKIHYLDITPDSRERNNHDDMLADDGLHPSPKAYEKWAEKLTALIVAQLK
jgi:lysophospholipase L1-like esterase